MNTDTTTTIHPDLTGPAAELMRVTRLIDAFREAKGLSRPQMARRYAGLGSDSTYGKCLSGVRIEELKLDVWLPRYQGVLATLQAERTATAAEIYDDLPHVTTVREAYKAILTTETSARVILIEGDTGSGKTSCRVALQRIYQDRIVCVEASTVWKDTPGALLSAILRALGVRTIPGSGAERLDAAIEQLSAKRRTVIVEEAHHLGPRLLNTVKTLVNSTPGEFVLLAMPTLWRRLEHVAYAEARQVTGSHRLAARIKIPPIDAQAAAHFVARRLGLVSTDDAPDERLEAVITELASLAAKHGNLGFIARCCERASTEHATLDAGALEAAIRVEKQTR